MRAASSAIASRIWQTGLSKPLTRRSERSDQVRFDVRCAPIALQNGQWGQMRTCTKECGSSAHSLGHERTFSFSGRVPIVRREFAALVVPDNYGRAPLAERAGAALTEGELLQSPVAMRVKVISSTSGPNGTATVAILPSRSVENERAS